MGKNTFWVRFLKDPALLFYDTCTCYECIKQVLVLAIQLHNVLFSCGKQQEKGQSREWKAVNQLTKSREM